MNKVQPEEAKHAMPGMGKKIGGMTNAQAKTNWRCAVCKFSNQSDLTACGMCREAKQVLKEAIVQPSVAA